MSCKTQHEVSEIVRENCDNLTNPFNEKFFFQAARQARIRIARISREKKKSYKIYQLN
jgi:hypothetical protein